MDLKKCGAIDCVWYDTDWAWCGVCEYVKQDDKTHHEGHEADETDDMI